MTVTINDNLNPIVLITGGSRGIGRTVALRFADRGSKLVFINYVQDDRAALEVQKELERRNTRCVLVKANLQYPGDIDRMFAEIRSGTGRIDSFVHCAAITAFKPLIDIKPNQWDLTMNINARSFLLCVQHLLPLMPSGSIVALSSLGSRRVVRNYGAMGPTKAALEAIVRYLSVELAGRDIRVNAVSGGLVDGESLRMFPDSEKLVAESMERTPAGRMGKPEDIADVVMYLVRQDSRWIRGQTLIADGGISII